MAAAAKSESVADADDDQSVDEELLATARALDADESEYREGAGDGVGEETPQSTEASNGHATNGTSSAQGSGRGRKAMTEEEKEDARRRKKQQEEEEEDSEVGHAYFGPGSRTNTDWMVSSDPLTGPQAACV